jgi:hypothetical protein
MPADPGIQYADFLYPHGIAGSHNCRNIMGIKNILQYNGQIILAFIQNPGQPFLSFRSHETR